MQEGSDAAGRAVAPMLGRDGDDCFYVRKCIPIAGPPMQTSLVIVVNERRQGSELVAVVMMLTSRNGALR